MQCSNPYWDEIKGRLNEVVDFFRTPEYIKSMAEGSAMWRSPYNVIPSLDSLKYKRNDFCRKYTWAIPDPGTIDFVVEHAGPSIVEMGAGTGYWAWMLHQRGIDVVAYDIAPPHISKENAYHHRKDEHEEPLLMEVYHPIEIGGPETLVRHTDRTLFLCWPPYVDDMASQCLKFYQGSRLIYIGEGDGGCNAESAFFEELETYWHETVSHDPIQWNYIHDYVHVYERGKEE